MSGEARGFSAALSRCGLRALEQPYSLFMLLRNWRFDAGYGVRHLPRLVISIGNITAGGTGKTPVVHWLCDQLICQGRHPAILMRGYKGTRQRCADEQVMLRSLLDDSAAIDPGRWRAIVHADPDRIRGGNAVLVDHGEVDCFVLDDGFQHRRLFRDFDLVLIDAVNPFGYGHVHPRGLLREPLAGLRRASAFLLTRYSQADPTARDRIIRILSRFNSTAPIYRADHVHTGLRDAEGVFHPLPDLAGRRYFVFCGLGNPHGFQQQIRSLPGQATGHRFFPDHHAYTAGDLATVDWIASSLGADLLLTTAKDWAKLAPLAAVAPSRLPIWRIELSIRFHADDAAKMLGQILACLPGEITGALDMRRVSCR